MIKVMASWKKKIPNSYSYINKYFYLQVRKFAANYFNSKQQNKRRIKIFLGKQRKSDCGQDK